MGLYSPLLFLLHIRCFSSGRSFRRPQGHEPGKGSKATSNHSICISFSQGKKSLLLAQQLPENRNIEFKSRHQRVFVDVEPGVVVGSRNVAADAHIGSLSAMGLDPGHQVGGVLGAGEASAGNVAGDLRDSGSPGFYEGLQGVG